MPLPLLNSMMIFYSLRLSSFVSRSVQLVYPMTAHSTLSENSALFRLSVDLFEVSEDMIWMGLDYCKPVQSALVFSLFPSFFRARAYSRMNWLSLISDDFNKFLMICLTPQRTHGSMCLPKIQKLLTHSSSISLVFFSSARSECPFYSYSKSMAASVPNPTPQLD